MHSPQVWRLHLAVTMLRHGFGEDAASPGPPSALAPCVRVVALCCLSRRPAMAPQDCHAQPRPSSLRAGAVRRRPGVRTPATRCLSGRRGGLKALHQPVVQDSAPPGRTRDRPDLSSALAPCDAGSGSRAARAGGGPLLHSPTRSAAPILPPRWRRAALGQCSDTRPALRGRAAGCGWTTGEILLRAA